MLYTLTGKAGQNLPQQLLVDDGRKKMVSVNVLTAASVVLFGHSRFDLMDNTQNRGFPVDSSAGGNNPRDFNFWEGEMWAIGKTADGIQIDVEVNMR